ncbi:small GTP-binding protein [Tritrichomonas foetus]|uniref:Small GTP-binding protein n=1 Tax=Tritrichomonas foetus TaxID=1144522 RepID=A0A1J4JNJ8_9EUKA|nr:small GTP-binding protein [Tritrichomonas foetus]|eukprot:OHS99083.1 small GTP-binding protein [Tritrichomonas foetus]
MTTKCKVVFLGAAGTGKTSLINRFMLNSFDKDYSTTVGIDFLTKPIQVQDQTVNLQIWDTAGQERFKSLVPSYIRGSDIAVLVYDVSDPRTFDEAIEWHKTVLSERGNDAVCILVGNKNDLENQVKQEKVLEFAQPKSIATAETSAKTGQNVSHLFKLISEAAPGIVKQKEIVIAQPEENIEQENKCNC